MQSGQQDRLTGLTTVKFSNDDELVKSSLNKQVLEDVVALVANENNKLATESVKDANTGWMSGFYGDMINKDGREGKWCSAFWQDRAGFSDAGAIEQPVEHGVH